MSETTLDDLIETAYSSLPSKGVNQSDIPIPKNISSEFQYNYFVFDETTNRDVTLSGDQVEAFTTLTSDATESDKRQALVDYDLPRFIKVTWEPMELDSVLNDGQVHNEIVTDTSSDGSVLIGENLSNILFEEVLTSNQYSGINLQDAEGLSKITDAAKVAIDTSEVPFTFADSDSATSTTDSNLDVVNSYLEAVGASTGLDSTAKELLRNALSSYQSMGDLSFNNRSEERESVINDSFFNTTTTFDMGMSVSNVMAIRCGNAWSKDGGSSFFEEIISVKDILSGITSAALSQESAGAINENDYDISGQPVNYRISQNIADNTSGEQYSARVVGYLVEKQEVDEDGSITVLSPLAVENPLSGDIIDPNVLYGKGYRYSVRTVAYVEFSAINVYPGNGSRSQTVIVGMLIASRPSKTTTSICVERIPPPPPVELSFIYDGVKKGLDISWSLPVNRQRDIKEFRIFRRSTTDSGYQLIKNYYFNDSTTLTKTDEIPDPDTLVSSESSKLSNSLFQVTSSPKMLYLDRDFDTRSSFIYAIASVDARGLCSNYSQQFRVTYDTFSARVEVDYLSCSGAPIPYPNLYLRNDLFVDTMKVSSFDKLSVYFDPEYLIVKDSDESDLEVIATNEDNPSYKLSIINLDSQKSKVIDIYVRDIRDDNFNAGEGIDYNVSAKVATLVDI
jgi:hypothetical protein